ncbi:amidohydrolase family protein [Marinomonas aquiplantarum]|uniref:D-galactarolactone isomerase n=1 Tax=Marinomonas aquiplantarum TaxID=491951 RepID=A0A366D5F4_9GAMM|nr:amidohydrolase family protein [Marinomonas aquiplantarum]RBO84759.1 D-galactarolactone isomerase [Marinomonas aquiplantarum]
MTRRLNGQAPNIALPKGSIDTHIHIYDAQHPNLPGGPAIPVDAANLQDYQQVMTWLGIEKVVITQPNAYQTNNQVLLNAVQSMGEKARGIVVVTPDTSEAELEKWHQMGARGARIMQLTQGAVRLKDLLSVNDKIATFGWSCIVQFNGREILEHASILNKIKGNFSLDHHGKFLPPVKINSAEFKQVLKLLDKGNCYYKIAACYESSATGGPDYEDVADMTKAAIKHAPERIIWGSNWPHVSGTPEQAPNDARLLDLIQSWIPDERTRQAIFVDNPERLYWHS